MKVILVAIVPNTGKDGVGADGGGVDVGGGDGVDRGMVGGRWVQAGFIRECANCVADRV